MSNVKNIAKARRTIRIIPTKKYQPKKPEKKPNSKELERRPDVIVDFEFERGLLSIIIENIGDDAAYNIEVKFSRKILGMQKTRDISSLAIFKRLKFLPPHKKIRVLVDSFSLYVVYKQPMEVKLTISFENKIKQRFENLIHHDLTIYKDIAEVYEPNKLT